MPAIIQPVNLQSDSLIDLHTADPRRYPVLLESVAHSGSLGSFDILMAFPGEQLESRDLRGNFLADLDRWWQAEKVESNESDLPFVGGWFLYLGYELANQIEPTLELRAPHSALARAVRIPAAVVRRHEDGAAWIVAEESAQHRIREIRADVSAAEHPSKQFRSAGVLDGGLEEDPPQEYLKIVGQALEHIAAGDIYQANLSRRWSGKLLPGIAPHDLYRRLRQSNPAPFAGLAVFENEAIVSSTPERLLSVRDGIVTTRPIAGTRPRSGDRQLDEDRLRELASHPKERAEHVMLIDLERNDLGRVCEPGTVVVDEFMTLETYEHVHHIVSNVRGTLRPSVTPGQVIRAIFPGGTITGCPKVRCMQIIGALERSARGPYTGSMGYLNRDGSMDLNILIRTLEVRDETVQFRAGAGIVADSVPLKELEETRAKARGLVRALE